MTATATRSNAPARVQCPHCTYSGEPGSSIAGHVAMAHPDVPIDEHGHRCSQRQHHAGPCKAFKAEWWGIPKGVRRRTRRQAGAAA